MYLLLAIISSLSVIQKIVPCILCISSIIFIFHDMYIYIRASNNQITEENNCIEFSFKTIRCKIGSHTYSNRPWPRQHVKNIEVSPQREVKKASLHVR